MHTILLAALAIASEPPADPVPAIDLATLTPVNAAAATGRSILFRVRPDSLPLVHEDGVCFDNAGDDTCHRTLRLRRHPRATGLVRGKLHVVRHPAAVHGGQRFPAFVELRLVED